jgi:hypothetical protein
MCVRERIITPSISACPPNASDCSSLFLANGFPTLQLSATVAFQRSPYKEDPNHINAFSGKPEQAFAGSNPTNPTLKIQISINIEEFWILTGKVFRGSLVTRPSDFPVLTLNLVL